MTCLGELYAAERIYLRAAMCYVKVINFQMSSNILWSPCESIEGELRTGKPPSYGN